MSAEALILIALFTLLPLAEQAWKRWQAKREAEARRRAGSHPARRPQAAAPVPPPLPRTPPGHMPLPDPAAAGLDMDEDEEVMVAADPDRRPVLPPPLPRPVKPVRPVTPARASRGGAHVRRPAVATSPQPRQLPWRDALRGPDDLRRGVVLLTVLGPCRAQHPYDGTPR